MIVEALIEQSTFEMSIQYTFRNVKPLKPLPKIQKTVTLKF